MLFFHVPMLVTGDDLFGHEPFIKLLRQLRYGFVLVAKPTSHKELFDWVEDVGAALFQPFFRWVCGTDLSDLKSARDVS